MDITLKRWCGVVLMLILSMGTMAAVDVNMEQFTGGTITASVGEEKGGEVVVTLTVAPDDGYTITKDDIEVYATISPNGTRTDSPQISSKLELKGDDPKDLSEKRDYTVTVASNFGVWVKTANFSSGSKGPMRSSNQYVLVDDEDGYMSLSGTTLDRLSSFDPRYALWTREANGSGKAYQITSGTTAYYLQINDASTPTEAIVSPVDALGSDQEWTDITYGFLLSSGGYYVYWDNDIWNLTQESVDHRVKAYPVTSGNGTFTTVTGVIPDDYGTINVAKTYNFTVTPTITNVAYNSYTFNDTPHYWYEDADHTELPESWGDFVEQSDLTSTWSLSDGAEEYATVNPTTGVLTVSNLPAANQSVVITLTCTLSFSGHSVVMTKDIILGEAMVEIYSLSDITLQNGVYRLSTDFSTTGTPDNSIGTKNKPFKGVIDGGLQPITGTWDKPLFDYVEDATIKNVIIQGNNTISKNGNDNVGAIAGTARGSSRIYNCGILPYSTEKDTDGKITGFTGTSISGSESVGSIVGQIEKNARVINCFSYATITNGNKVGGIVGNLSSDAITQDNLSTVGMVVNCMFYGEITGGTTKRPVYGGKMIKTDAQKGVNPYCFFRANASFDDNYTGISDYYRSWPAEEEYLTRFEYYRSILNSNRLLCTWWVNGNVGTAPTDEDVTKVGIAKWVMDPSMAPYPILKTWGKYPSIINPDPTRTWDPEANNGIGDWQSRSSASPYRGRSLGTLRVTVNPGGHAAGGASSKVISLTITDIDSLNYDYGYYKVQLPYYNEQFGDPSSNDHDTRYGGNYKDWVVTGWKVTSILGGTQGTFTENWESGYNFADRYCTNKDLYSISKRVFAQGGFFYVPEGVTDITIEAYWGKAIYLHNTGHYIDRVNITNQKADGSRKLGDPFTSSGTLPTTFQGQTVYDAWDTAIKNLDAATETSGKLSLTVYDQAIVLLSNFQVRNENGKIGYDVDSKWHPYTLMSADLDLDNEPDFCFEFQYRNNYERLGIQPIRFDFLPVPELGMAVRHKEQLNTIGIFIPQGHFEITETSFMHTTQFEYDFDKTKIESPVILNGGHFEQIVVRKGDNKKTSYFLMGGHFRMLRFTPGRHTNKDCNGKTTRHCAVNCIGGDYPEFYLSGIYNVKVNTNTDNPHCYTNGGNFGIIAGAGYEPIGGNITFKIDHSIINEFYGGGINGSKPVQGSIDVTIDHSLVYKYCGGPKVGVMASGKTVTTHATGSTFTRYYGGGNGGTSYYREQTIDGNYNMPASTAEGWANYGYKDFNPLNSISSVTKSYEGPNTDLNRGYHALFEFECFVESNGIGASPTIRGYRHWAQFGTTSTGNITNELNDCTIKGDFYGGGNLGNVSGSVTSTLTDCTIEGSAFAGGFSGQIEPFRIHNKSATEFPYIDKGGIMHNGTLYYVKNDDGSDRYYTWCYKKSDGQVFPEGVTIPSNINTNNPVFEFNGKWYVLTTVSLEGLGAVTGDTELSLKGNTTIGNVYGGGNESVVVGQTMINVEGNSHVLGNVFGGGNKANVNGSVIVNIKNGLVDNDVYGGGALAHTNVSSLSEGVQKTTSTTVNLLGGTVSHNVYGGGLGTSDVRNESGQITTSGIKAQVYGNAFVNLNGLQPDDYNATIHNGIVSPVPATGTVEYYLVSGSGCVVKGNVFGCNNLNGSPKGSATVHVYKTAGTARTAEGDLDDLDASKHKYHLEAVYGGGNLSAYEPSESDVTQTHVIIDGCDLTSIRQVYGGGNAASTPSTKVDIRGTYEIEEVFGGGNGYGTITLNGEVKPNPGANVGFYEYVDDIEGKTDTPENRAANYKYGTGEANVNIYGGKIHRVFGGSNTKGNVRVVAVTMLDEQSGCDFCVDEAYGGGKSATMDGSAILKMACIPGLKAAYGGAQEANIHNNVVLNITNGDFDRVFGGNNLSGSIDGSITVNIEETGCSPVKIKELYGGGNQAAYSIYGYKKVEENGEEVLKPRMSMDDGEAVGARNLPYDAPQVHIKSFTTIGDVFGGGYGASATMVGSPHVNINQVYGKVYETVDGKRTFTGRATTLGTINNVFGGGNEAEVIGDTYVNIGTEEKIDFVTSEMGSDTPRTGVDVVGADIRGNVYGGGNKAEVTGNTNVVIGRQATE